VFEKHVFQFDIHGQQITKFVYYW